MTSSEAPSDVSSLFAKKKGKKGKKGPKAYNLNLDSGITKPEETPKMAAMNEILGGADPSEDDGWAEVVEKKSVVATGGKQVSELIDMTSLMTEDESTASKLEKQDIKQAFHDARMLREKEEPARDASKDDGKGDETARAKGLSGNIFAGGAARGGWQARMQERELMQREQELSVDNASAFPTLADAMSGPPKPRYTSGGSEGNPWVRRGGGSAAAAAIKAALAAGNDGSSDAASGPGGASGEKAKPKAKAKMAEPVWVAPRMVKSSESNPAEQASEATVAKVEEEAVPKVNGRRALGGREREEQGAVESGRREENTAEVEKAREAEEEKAREAEEKAREAAAEKEREAEKAKAVVQETAPVESGRVNAAMEPAAADKEALVQQFGKKKKKKKKAAGED